MKAPASSLFLILCLTWPLTGGADDDKAQLVKEKAEETNAALVKGDYSKVVDLTHPKLVEQLGGRAKMVAMMESGMKEMKAQGIRFQSATVGVPSQMVAEEGQMFCTVPVLLKMAVPGGTLTQKSYLIASSGDGGTRWHFVDGSGVDAEKLKLVYGKFPAKLQLPEKEQPVFEKAK